MSKAKIKMPGMKELVDVDVNPETNMLLFNGIEYHCTDIQMDIPVTGTIFGTLLNYKGALKSLGEAVNEKPYLAPPIAPVLYIKPANTFTNYGGIIPMPEGISELEVGAALGIVIGKQATRISEEEALDYVAGYTVVNDVSVPHKSVFRPAVKHKSRDGFCPIGPWIIDRDAVANPNDLAVRVYINGELRQENTTFNLIRPIARLFAEITDYMTLSEGDVLLVGVPENPPVVKVGDDIRIEIENIGSLENKVAHEQIGSKGAGK
jgi:5-oxopent-3-ene-1,2,5-tricarboxylate decarboxylase / 2-hydroxyhepta-2,4-diene-1,7-dioate isomerase